MEEPCTTVITGSPAAESFAKAAEVALPRMSGLRLAESTVERTAEAVGAEVGHAIEAKVPFDEARPWGWHKDADVPEVDLIYRRSSRCGRSALRC